MWMSHSGNDLSILDLRRKAHPFRSTSELLKHSYCLKELVELNRLIGLIRKMTFYSWFMRNCGSPYISFSCLQAYAQLSSSSAVKSQAAGWTSHTRDNTHVWWCDKGDCPALCAQNDIMQQFSVRWGLCRVAECCWHFLQGYQFSCWWRCGNKGWSFLLWPRGAHLQSVCPAIALLTVHEAMLPFPPWR